MQDSRYRFSVEGQCRQFCFWPVAFRVDDRVALLHKGTTRTSKRPPEDWLCSLCVVRTGASAFGAKIPCAFQGFVRECLVFKTNFWSLGASMRGPCTQVVKAFRNLNDVEAIRRQTPSEQSAQSTKSVSSDVSCDSTSRQQCVAVNQHRIFHKPQTASPKPQSKADELRPYVSC